MWAKKERILHKHTSSTSKKIASFVVFVFFLIFTCTPVRALDLEPANVILNALVHFGAGSQEFLQQKNESTVVNLKNDQDGLKVLKINFHNLELNADVLNAQAGGINIFGQDDDESIKPEVLGPALCYPNPFRQANGGTIGYRLSKNMDLEIHIYDMLAHCVFKKTFNKGTMGGQAGYNKVQLNLYTLDTFELSAGVYFFFLVNNGKLLAKGKMAVKP